MLTPCPSGPAAIVAAMTDSSDVLAAEFVPRRRASSGKLKVPTRYRRVPKPADECGRMLKPDSCA